MQLRANRWMCMFLWGIPKLLQLELTFWMCPSLNQTSNNETMKPWQLHSSYVKLLPLSLSLSKTVSRWRAVWEREGGEWQEDTAGEETMRCIEQNRIQAGRRHRNWVWKHLMTFWILLTVRYLLFSLILQLLLCCFVFFTF